MNYHRAIAVLAAASMLGATACGDDVSNADDADTTIETVASVPPTTHSGTHPTSSPTSSPTTIPTTSTPPASPIDDGVLTIELSDFAFDGLPESVPAGTKLAIENTSSTEVHEIVALRIVDTETRSAAELMALPEGELRAATSPMPATVLVAAPGGRQIDALGDGTLSEPGRYLLLCAIPTGADPAEYMQAAAESVGPPDVPGGPPHFVHGMFAELTVE